MEKITAVQMVKPDQDFVNVYGNMNEPSKCDIYPVLYFVLVNVEEKNYLRPEIWPIDIVGIADDFDDPGACSNYIGLFLESDKELIQKEVEDYCRIQESLERRKGK